MYLKLIGMNLELNMLKNMLLPETQNLSVNY